MRIDIVETRLLAKSHRFVQFPRSDRFQFVTDPFQRDGGLGCDRKLFLDCISFCPEVFAFVVELGFGGIIRTVGGFRIFDLPKFRIQRGLPFLHFQIALVVSFCTLACLIKQLVHGNVMDPVVYLFGRFTGHGILIEIGHHFRFRSFIRHLLGIVRRTGFKFGFLRHFRLERDDRFLACGQWDGNRFFLLFFGYYLRFQTCFQSCFRFGFGHNFRLFGFVVGGF